MAKLGVIPLALACALEVRYPLCKRGISTMPVRYRMKTRQKRVRTISKGYFQGEIIYTPHPPHFWLKGIFPGRGVGVYILSPYAAGIFSPPPPPVFHPPTPRRVFSGVGGWGCVKFGEYCATGGRSISHWPLGA